MNKRQAKKQKKKYYIYVPCLKMWILKQAPTIGTIGGRSRDASFYAAFGYNCCFLA